MSYGSFIIAEDLKKGITVKQVAIKIHDRYPDISMNRAIGITRKIKKYGATTKIDWSRK